jgi:hypothetical protein
VLAIDPAQLRAATLVDQRDDEARHDESHTAPMIVHRPTLILLAEPVNRMRAGCPWPDGAGISLH